MAERKTLCIYHGNCADGFGAAWVVHKAVPDCEFQPGVYQNPPPDVTGRNVIIVDFSYQRPVLESLLESCESLLILDHHQTAKDDLSFLPPALNCYADHLNVTISVMLNTLETIGMRRQWIDNYVGPGAVQSEIVKGATNKGHALFDLSRSGAMIAWNFFFPNLVPPRLLEHIQDRDLWRFEIPGTREIQANLFSYPYDFNVWDGLMRDDPNQLIQDGHAIERKHHKDIAELVQITQRRMMIGGVDVPVANLPYTLSSDAGHLMAQGEPFAACYWDGKDGRNFSLRSTDNGLDVSIIAKQYGGGGHRNASGFRVPFTHSLAVNN